MVSLRDEDRDRPNSFSGHKPQLCRQWRCGAALPRGVTPPRPEASPARLPTLRGPTPSQLSTKTCGRDPEAAVPPAHGAPTPTRRLGPAPRAPAPPAVSCSPAPSLGTPIPRAPTVAPPPGGSRGKAPPPPRPRPARGPRALGSRREEALPDERWRRVRRTLRKGRPRINPERICITAAGAEGAPRSPGAPERRPSRWCPGRRRLREPWGAGRRPEGGGDPSFLCLCVTWIEGRCPAARGVGRPSRRHPSC